MLQMMGGRVTYGRTVKVADYENKKAEFSLDFGFEQGAPNYEELLTMAGQIALRKCHEVLGIDLPSTKKLPEPEPDKVADTLVSPAKPGKPSLKRKEAVAPLPAPPKEEVIVEAPATNPNAELEDILSAAPPAKPITDHELTSEIMACNVRTSNPTGIKAILASVGGIPAGAAAATIPQERRAAVIEALATVKPTPKA